MYLSTYFLDVPDSVFCAVAEACRQAHRKSCNDQSECTLHALGVLWVDNRFPSPGAVGQDWDFAFWCLSELIENHPLRSWSQRALCRTAISIAKSEFSCQQALSLLSSTLEASPSAVFVNSESNANSWRTILESCTGESKRQALELGNIMISRGLTSIIETQLDEYPAMGFDFYD